jgi:DNA-binding Lrp family transcriptional regulator
MATQKKPATRVSARKEPLDDLDQEILKRLKLEPRCTNKSLAEALSVSEVTIAARIRAMENDRVMRVMAQQDMRAAGFNVLALVDVEVAGRAVDAVAADLARIEQVGSVSLLMGEPALVIEVHAATLEELQSVLLDQVGKVKGVNGTVASLVVDVIKYDSAYGNLRA